MEKVDTGSLQCRSCHSQDVELKAYKKIHLDNILLEDVLWYCKLCSHSMSGNLYKYDEGSGFQQLSSIICFVGNEILKAIKANDLK